ncbi:wax ester/triacylglycerol synthase family O-acyltransferase [Nocardioides rotundus]|uniref:WS/DGAT/MGAT family O-acyltransferase n=1 Tax=Nocardioides rotundus TaxID=1774216 RepID=UPI001CBAEDEF|nr:wax ester/triacylglycerol synthase family O-acyltransferase [Nocardioides rotundus]UAL30748.1 wax ester/triacylglycerol synthase family O-acyltransferase [Nocardioides rotundus]
MSDRLRPRDLGLLALETGSSPMHNATVEIFDPGDSGFDYASLVSLIGDRISFVPRYRQRLVRVPGRLANPAWVDDPDFDLAYHVRRSALPRPGSHDQLRELVARIISRPLDRHRPLWEVYFVEGLEGGRVAVLAKSHQVLVDGVDTVDLGQVLLDTVPEPKAMEYDQWRPRGRPTSAGMVAEALADTLQHPSTALSTAVATTESAVRTAVHALAKAGELSSALAGRRPVHESPINRPLSQQRRFVTVKTSLADYRTVRKAHGGTVNDVILATVAGAVRTWLMTRAESLGGLRKLRVIVPMSVIDDELEATSLGTQITGHLVDLPIGEASPVVRLHQVSYSFRAHRETSRAVAANRLAGIAGFAPTTFHALGARLAADELRTGFQLSVTNVPGPQFPLYAAGAQMLETYPVPPLLPQHALAIGVTSYDNNVYYGITADRDALPDVDVLGDCLTEALVELVDTTSGTRTRAPRGRRTPPKKSASRAQGRKS